MKRLREFFFDPIDARPLAWFRLLHGLLVAVSVLLLIPDRALWLSDQGLLTQRSAFELHPEPQLGALSALNLGSTGLAVYLAALAVLALASGIGLFPRVSAALLYLGLVSLHHRNTLILTGADTLLRVTLFWLIFAPSQASWLHLRRRSESTVTIVPWTQRMIQLQIALVYLCGGLYKLMGSQWQDGSAIYYATRYLEMRRWDPWPISWILAQPSLVQFATWGVVAFELGFAVLVWKPRLARQVLWAGVAIHGGLELIFNIPFFQWAMLASYVLFVPAPVSRPTRSQG